MLCFWANRVERKLPNANKSGNASNSTEVVIETSESSDVESVESCEYTKLCLHIYIIIYLSYVLINLRFADDIERAAVM